MTTDLASDLWNNRCDMISLIVAAAISAGQVAPPPVPIAPLAQSQPAAPEVALPDRAAAWYEFLAGRHLEGEGDVSGAIDAYKRAAALDPRSAEIQVELAGLYMRMNRIDEATAAAEQALAIDPDSLDAHRILGLVYSAMARRQSPGRDYARDAIRHLERVYSATGRGAEPTVMLTLGRLYLRTGANDKAIAVLRQFVEEAPEYPEGGAMLAQAYASAGRTAEAAGVLEELAAQEPRYLQPLAELYERTSQWEKAAAAYGRALERNPGDADLKSRYTIALLNSPAIEDASKARKVLEEQVAARPTDQQALYLLSQAQTRQRDFTAAEETSRRILKDDPENLLGLYALAQVFEAQEQPRKVIDTLAPAVASWSSRADTEPRSDVARLYLHLGFAYQQLKEYDRAIATLEQGRRYARDAMVLFQLGSVFEQQKKYADAERTFREALQRDPLHAPTLNYLGYMLADRGEKLDDAVTLIKRALEIDPENASYLDSLGWAYFKMNRLDLAEEPLRRASTELQTNSVVQDHWGDLLFKLGRYHEAIAAWERALAGDGDSIDKTAIDRKIKAARTKAG
jgi:tetratricopeptide (TPR) repeat protein